MASDQSKLELINSVHNVVIPERKKPKKAVASPLIFSMPKTVENMRFIYNPDGTLNKLVIDNKESTEYSFIWNQNMTLHRIQKKETS